MAETILDYIATFSRLELLPAVRSLMTIGGSWMPLVAGWPTFLTADFLLDSSFLCRRHSTSASPVSAGASRLQPQPRATFPQTPNGRNRYDGLQTGVEDDSLW
jgi:hypothetical protein